LDGSPYDPLNDEDVKYYKYSEIQFHMVLAQEALYEVLDDNMYVRLSTDVLDIVLSKLWDESDGGFVRNGNQDGEVLAAEWGVHYTVVQGQAVVALERLWGYGLPVISFVRVSPTNPRPQDEISVAAVVLDNDGIDRVIVNMTIEGPAETSIRNVELGANPSLRGLYNNTIGMLANGTRVNFFVFANDTTGRAFIEGSFYFIVREDVFSPVVWLSRVYPLTGPRVGDDVVIEIETYEFPIHSHLVSCQLFWKAGAGSYKPVNMTAVGTDSDYVVWQTNLGQFQGGDVVSYYCLAVDETGNMGESPFYRLTILGPLIYVTPMVTWQVLAAIGLVAAPGIGYAYSYTRKRRVMKVQRERKKAQRIRSRRHRPRRDRSRKDSGAR
jgi:hypothetical protein